MSSQQVVINHAKLTETRKREDKLRDPTLISESLLAYFHRGAVSNERITANKKEGANNQIKKT